MSVLSQTNQFKYIGNGPLDGKSVVATYEDLKNFPYSERWIGMTVTVKNADTTKIPIDYWLLGGIGNRNWVKKMPNYDLRLDGDGHLYLIEQTTGISGSSIDIKQFIEEHITDQYINSGSVIEENNKFYLKLEYAEEKNPLLIDLSKITGGLDPTKYYTKEQVDAKISEVETHIPDVSKFVTSGYVTSVVNIAAETTKQWVEGKGYLTEHQSLSAYSTTDGVEEMIDEAKTDTKTWVNQNFVTSGYVNEKINGIEGKIDTLSGVTNVLERQVSDMSDLMADMNIRIDSVSGETVRLEKRIDELVISAGTVVTDEKSIIKTEGVISVQMATGNTTEEISNKNAITTTNQGIGIYITGDDVEY